MTDEAEVYTYCAECDHPIWVTESGQDYCCSDCNRPVKWFDPPVGRVMSGEGQVALFFLQYLIALVTGGIIVAGSPAASWQLIGLGLLYALLHMAYIRSVIRVETLSVAVRSANGNKR